MKIMYPEAYDALITHSNRHKILMEKLNENTEYVIETNDITLDDALKRMDILADMNMNLASMIGDYESIVKEFQIGRNITNTALRAYADYYGNELVLPEGYIDFGTKFNLRAHVTPQPGKTIVTIEIEDENGNKYFGRRTYYQKIRDWFILLRQSLRKS